MERGTRQLIGPWVVVPIAASMLALAVGLVAGQRGALEILVPAGHIRSVALEHYAFILTHLAVGAGLVLGGVVTLVGLLRDSNTALLVGQLSVLASFAGLLILDMFSLWVPSAMI